MTRQNLDLDGYVPYFVRAISNVLGQAASRLYSERFGIGLNEWSCLALLANESDVTASRISEVSGFDKAVISRSLGALERKGLVVSRPMEGHRRKRLIDFTDAGRAVHREIAEIALAREQKLLDGLTPGDRLRLLEILRLMHANACRLSDDETAAARQGAIPEAE